MEENKTIRRRFNIFDVVIIALVLAVLAAALLLRDSSTGQDAARDTTPIRYTVELAKAPADMAEHMTIGSDVYRATDSAYLGKVAEVRRIPHVENEYSPALGKFVRVDYRESCDIYLTIEGEGYSTARDIIVESAAPKVCGEFSVKGKGYARIGYVCGIDPMDATIVPNTEVGAGSLEATYVIRLEDMREMLLDGVHVGDRLYEKVTGALLGEVVDIWTEPYGETHPAPDGSGAVYAEKEGVYHLYIRLKGRAVVKDDGYYLDGGTELKVGAQVIVTSQYIDRTGIFYALESIEAVK